MANIGPMLEPLSKVCTMTGEVCGEPELPAALEAAGVAIYTRFRPGEARRPEGSRSAGEGVDQREADQHAEHPERHPAPEERGHRAGSGTDTVGRSERIGTEVTRTRGRRCDS